jgi:glycosyltransferase involved in cell wall biosynthesis
VIESQEVTGKWTIVVPAYNEEATIALVVEEYVQRDDVERVIVVNNRSKDRTAELARAAGADVIDEERPGYGSAIRAGLDHALETKAGLIAITEGDGTFRAADLPKFHSFLGEHDLVLGSRTHRMLIGEGANLGRALRWGNRAMAKYIELMWWLPNEPSLSDVGCTYRALRAEVWRTLRGGMRTDGPEFAPEMMCEAFRRRLRVVQIPVRYGARLGGQSQHSENLSKSARTALRMFRTISRKRLLG